MMAREDFDIISHQDYFHSWSDSEWEDDEDESDEDANEDDDQ